MVWLSADEPPLHNQPRTPSLFLHLAGDEDHDEDDERDHDGGDGGPIGWYIGGAIVWKGF